ncbi:MAG: hypothetical protein QM598_14045 [Protaetiibacter sp.]
MGFSPLGLIVGFAVLAPNLLLLRFPPRDPLPRVAVPRMLSWLERAGQALCLVVPAITEPGPIAWWWVAPVAVALAIYYALWVRYLRSGRPVSALYRALWRAPVPMAILPVAVFLSTSAWLGDVWIAAAALVLGLGHIPVAVLNARALGVLR